jgi:hypothetical protein
LPQEFTGWTTIVEFLPSFRGSLQSSNTGVSLSLQIVFQYSCEGCAIEALENAAGSANATSAGRFGKTLEFDFLAHHILLPER